MGPTMTTGNPSTCYIWVPTCSVIKQVPFHPKNVSYLERTSGKSWSHPQVVLAFSLWSCVIESNSGPIRSEPLVVRFRHREFVKAAQLGFVCSEDWAPLLQGRCLMGAPGAAQCRVMYHRAGWLWGFRFKPKLRDLPGMCPWTSSLTSLCFSFLINKTEIWKHTRSNCRVYMDIQTAI